MECYEKHASDKICNLEAVTRKFFTVQNIANYNDSEAMSSSAHSLLSILFVYDFFGEYDIETSKTKTTNGKAIY